MKNIKTFSIVLVSLFYISCTKSSNEIKKTQANRIVRKLQRDTLMSLDTAFISDVRRLGNLIPKIEKDNSVDFLVYVQSADSLIRANLENRSMKVTKEVMVADSIQKANYLRTIDKLKAKFKYKKDEFKDIGFYTHKTWGEYYQQRKTLTSGVSSEGYVWLRSNYFSSDWLFHDHIFVLIDGEKYTSEIIPSYEKNNVTEVGGSGQIYEVVTYSNNLDIIRAIATNVDKTIKVRFEGPQHYDDITLQSRDKKAISDCYNLAKAIEFSKTENKKQSDNL